LQWTDEKIPERGERKPNLAARMPLSRGNLGRLDEAQILADSLG
jgi:hypothetical protein